ncbi:MAG: glycerol-3-phosphate 1-O-acyltransferase PlsY [Eggerthellaceae bacterium]|nr:glycerol-3-phosphate 1-O-acyltransferase PlsY [Eggerthellaceae bacterium]
MGVFAYILILVISFFLGSIPWGLVISKVFFGKDLRDEGSGNIGTTNAIRAMGKPAGYAVFVLDFGKGLLSGFIALGIAGLFSMGKPATDIATAVAFLGCVYGHIFSPWLGFKGGKGIAVAIGCLFVTFGPIGAFIELLIFAVLVIVFRYVSLGSVASALACPFIALVIFWGNWPAVILCAIVGFTVVWAHRANIRRLLDGTERRVGESKQSGQQQRQRTRSRR